jgi:hypothetical protein
MVRTDRMIRALLLTGLAGIARVVLAADLATHAIHIPAQDLGSALLEFAAATHQQIAFDPQQVRGYRSTALSGTYAVEDGLQTLTGSAPFLIRTTPSGVLTVAAAPAVSSEPVRAAAQRSAPPLQVRRASPRHRLRSRSRRGGPNSSPGFPSSSTRSRSLTTSPRDSPAGWSGSARSSRARIFPAGKAISSASASPSLRAQPVFRSPLRNAPFRTSMFW